MCITTTHIFHLRPLDFSKDTLKVILVSCTIPTWKCVDWTPRGAGSCQPLHHGILPCNIGGGRGSPRASSGQMLHDHTNDPICSRSHKNSSTTRRDLQTLLCTSVVDAAEHRWLLRANTIATIAIEPRTPPNNPQSHQSRPGKPATNRSTKPDTFITTTRLIHRHRIITLTITHSSNTRPSNCFSTTNETFLQIS